MSNKDKSMMAICIAEETAQLFTGFSCDHPLDAAVMKKIKELHQLIRDNDDDYEIFRHSAKTDQLWRLLLSKAIRCLRFFDKREPFNKENTEKKPKAYGLDELNEYYMKYKEFESMLYGSGQYYRDHVVHVLRTWFSGVECMVKNDGDYLNFISILDSELIELNRAEKISIWTIIALTHDLGYPLEKAKKIIDTTHSMVSTFVANPNISMDLSFHGVQNYMNDFVVRLMSSKMVYAGTEEEAGKKIRKYVARLQPKYYFKFQKSLERTNHGIISTLIIYKLLTYFLESDYNINEDYKFDPEDCRQFYIRREILRSIASHTCTDVYHLYMGTFAFLLIITDDTQEWGRKYISELYTSSGDKYEPGEIDLTIAKKSDSEDSKLDPHYCKISEKMVIPERKGPESVIRLMKRLKDQALNYVTIFRDGQDTIKRDFSFIRKYVIEYESSPNISFDMTLTIANDKASSLTGDIKYSSNKIKNEIFNQNFINGLHDSLELSVTWEIYDDEDKPVNKNDPATWRKGKISIDLANDLGS